MEHREPPPLEKRYNTLVSPAPTWSMRSNRCASSCTTPGSRTLPSSSAFFATSRALFLLVYTLALVLSSLSHQMRTGQGAPTPAAPHRATASTSATTWCHGRPSVRPLSLTPVLKQSSAASCASFSRSSIYRYPPPRLSSVTTSMLST